LGAWGTQSAKAEALMLYAMLGRNGDTVESLRELIRVPAKIEAALRLYASKDREDGAGIEGVIEFRRRVSEEFERLVRESESVALPDFRLTKQVNGTRYLLCGREKLA
jgi:hypothetical protein